MAKNGTITNNRYNRNRISDTVGSVKVINLLDNYGFVKEPRASEASNSVEEFSGLKLSLMTSLAVNANPSMRAACDDRTDAPACNVLKDARWTSLSTLHCRGDPQGESTQGESTQVPPHGRESKEEIDDIVASADWDADLDGNILDLWDVDELNVNTRAGLSHLHKMAACNRIFIGDAPEGTDSGRNSVDLFKALGKDGVVNLLMDLARGCDATLSIMNGLSRNWVHVGPSSGEKMHFDSAAGTLRITVMRKKLAVPNKQLPRREEERTTKGPLSRASNQPRQDRTGKPVTQASGGFDDLGNPDIIDSIYVEKQALKPFRGNSPVFENSPGVTEWIAHCKNWKGTEYPPPEINANFSHSISKLRIRPSPIQGDGVFLASNVIKGELFGFYEGVRCDHKGPYVMNIFAKNVDGSPDALGRISVYAMINEDLSLMWKSSLVVSLGH